MIANLFLFALLISLTAFFVASEFAMVKVRSVRIEQLVIEGKKGSLSAQKVVNNLDAYLSACQLGITVTALGIGMIGERTFEHILHPLFENIGIPIEYVQSFTLVGAFAIATFMHVVIGELAPKTAALQKSEQITLLFSGPLIFFYRLLYPFIWLLNGSAQLLVGLFGMKVAGHGEIYTSDELKLLMQESSEHGEITAKEYEFVNNALSISNIPVSDIFVPRMEMIILDGSKSIFESLILVEEYDYSRYPVFLADKDNIIGYINSKEIYKNLSLNKDMLLKDLVSEIPFVLKSLSADKVLRKMQNDSKHLIMVIDEYGGINGLITMEDILEELIGEIRDEYDSEECDLIQIIEENVEYVVDGKTSIKELEELLNVNISDGEEELNKIGGLFLKKEKDNFVINNVEFIVIERENMSIKKVKILILKPETDIVEKI